MPTSFTNASPADKATITTNAANALGSLGCPGTQDSLCKHAEKYVSPGLGLSDETVPDPRDKRATLPVRVVRVLDVNGAVRFGGSGTPEPMTIEQYIKELVHTTPELRWRPQFDTL